MRYCCLRSLAAVKKTRNIVPKLSRWVNRSHESLHGVIYVVLNIVIYKTILVAQVVIQITSQNVCLILTFEHTTTKTQPLTSRNNRPLRPCVFHIKPMAAQAILDPLNILRSAPALMMTTRPPRHLHPACVRAGDDSAAHSTSAWCTCTDDSVLDELHSALCTSSCMSTGHMCYLHPAYA